MEAGYGEEGKKFQGVVVIMEGKSPKEAEEMAKAAALEWTDKRNTAWTDGSRLENQKVGCAVVWQEEVGTAQHHKRSKKRRQVHGLDGKENGGWKTTSYHPHQSGGREGGTWDKRFGNKATPSSRKPNTTDGPGRDTTSEQTKRCSMPNYMPSTEQSCDSENGANTTKNTPYLSTHSHKQRWSGV